MDPKNQPIMKDVSYDIYQPFGPSVLKTKLPALYVHKINEISDTKELLLMKDVIEAIEEMADKCQEVSDSFILLALSL